MKKIILSFSAVLCVIFAAAENLKPVAQKISERKAENAAFKQAQLFIITPASVQRSAEMESSAANATVFELEQSTAAQILSGKPENLSLVIPVKTGNNIELELYRADIFTPDFTVVTSTNNGAAVPYDGGVHYQGIIKGDNQSVAAISIFDGEVMGMISTPLSGNLILGKIENDPLNRHILYNERNLKASPTTQCYTMDDRQTYPAKQLQDAGQKIAVNCIRLYWEVNFDIYQGKGSVTNATNYVTGLFNQSAIIYTNDNIPVTLSQVFVWNTASPYTSSSTSGLLSQFQATRNSFNGDLGNLLGYAGGGGVAAGFSGFCASNLDNSMCYSGISSSYNNVPTYSWTVMVVTHEQGHLMGSRHTHACVWNGNNTAIDNCGPNAGYGYEGSCSGAPTPVNGGTIMSYCHLTVGINFSNGFGTQPKNVILNGYNNAGCLGPCATGGCGVPYALSASSVTVSSATVSWGFITGAISYNLQYKKSSLPTWTTITGITTTSRNLTSLTDGTAYDYQVQAVCSSATSAYSPVATFSTVAICNDPYEPNNLNASATVIPVNTNIAGLVSPQNDIDVFKFNNTSAQKNIKITLSGLPADYDLKLFKGGVEKAASQHGGTSTETIVYNTTVVGTYVIRAYGSGGANNATACYTLNAQISATAFRTGEPGNTISETGEKASEISVYPNPANDILNIDFPVTENSFAKISILDQTGREVAGFTSESSNTTGHVQLDMSKFSNGIYFVRVIQGENVVTQKLTVNH
ncbi:MAG TPA: T9SS type A sorting domain-containing protein [Bacteroidia bacterium]|nr:T9SS type A sorting domain-containing protein [Bacteroidia bacterium]